MLKMLLVDDEYLEREAFKSMLNEISESVTVVGEATNGEMAVKLAKELKPNIIFIDDKMPRLTGTEAAKIIKEIDSNIIVYLMCSYSDRIQSHVNNKDYDGMITKPVRVQDIELKLKEYMDMYEEKIFSKDGLLENLLKKIHEENYREARIQLCYMVAELSKMNQSLTDLRNTVGVIVNSILKICEVKGIKKYLPNKKWIDGITIYNIRTKLEDLLKEIFKVILRHTAVPSQNEIKFILNYIEMHYTDGVSLEEVADYVHLSPHYVSRLFKKEVKTTFVNYVTNRKIEHAKELLKNTDLPVVHIAMNLSFQEHTYFSKVFKKIVGLTPTEYRNKHRKSPPENINHFNSKIIGNWYI